MPIQALFLSTLQGKHFQRSLGSRKRAAPSKAAGVGVRGCVHFSSLQLPCSSHPSPHCHHHHRQCPFRPLALFCHAVKTHRASRLLGSSTTESAPAPRPPSPTVTCKNTAPFTVCPNTSGLCRHRAPYHTSHTPDFELCNPHLPLTTPHPTTEYTEWGPWCPAQLSPNRVPLPSEAWIEPLQ